MAFKVMTWNVENLFQDSANYQVKLDSLSSMIAALTPDVLALQEVGSDNELSDLRAAVQAKGVTFVDQHRGKAGDRGISVAFLSRLPLTDHGDITELAGNFPVLDIKGNPIRSLSRGAPHVSVQVAGLTVHLIAAHLKSKLLTFGPNQFSTKDENLRARVGGEALLKRTAEAVTLRLGANKVLTDHPTEAVVLLGDLNDVPEAATTQILHGPTGSQPGTKAFSTKDNGDAARLFNLAGVLPIQERYTRVHNGVNEMIDHILVSEELVPPGADSKRIAPIVSVQHPGKLPSIADNPNERKTSPISDHAAVLAEFDLK